VAQESELVLKRATMVTASKGMEKFVCAPLMSLVIASPSVTFPVTPETVVVEHPVALALVHVEPVKPFVQIHAQEPLSKMLVPPFLHDVVDEASHCWTAVRVDVEEDVFLWKTRNSRGTTTAAAAATRRRNSRRRNPQRGRPQHRRFFLG
jgi:hypothetical protein